MIRGLQIIVYICCITVSEAQTQTEYPSYFIGNDMVFTNQIRANGILTTDSNVFLVDISGINYYGVEYLNTYGINLGHIHQGTGYKFSYKYYQENVFLKHNAQLGVQKQMSKNLQVNVMLGSELRSIDRQKKYDVLYGLSVRYRIQNQLYIHQEIKHIPFQEKFHPIEYHSALQYKISNQFSTLAQLDYNNQFEGRIGVLIYYWNVRMQCSHRFVQNRIEIGVGYKYQLLDFSFLYSYHEVLGGQSYAIIQLAL